MPTTVQGMEIAMPTSDHLAPGPAPAMTNTPPLDTGHLGHGPLSLGGGQA